MMAGVMLITAGAFRLGSGTALPPAPMGEPTAGNLIDGCRAASLSHSDDGCHLTVINQAFRKVKCQ
jgi:hypothetical protein